MAQVRISPIDRLRARHARLEVSIGVLMTRRADLEERIADEVRKMQAGELKRFEKRLAAR